MTLRTLLLLAAILSLETPSFAQFHTITADRCQTRQQKGTPAETDVPNVNPPNANNVPNGATPAANDVSNGKLLFPTDVSNGKLPVDVPTQQEWVSRFASVSYPLRNIFVTSPFGYRRDPFISKRAFHNGLDFRANAEPVYAMLSGEVVKTGRSTAPHLHITCKKSKGKPLNPIVILQFVEGNMASVF